MSADGICSGGSVITYSYAMRVTRMGITSPIPAGAAILPVVWGLARGEKPAVLRPIGILVTIAGSSSSRGRARRRTASTRAPPRGLRRRRAPALVAVGPMVIGADLLFAKAAMPADLSVAAVLGRLSPAVTTGASRRAAAAPLTEERTGMRR